MGGSNEVQKKQIIKKDDKDGKVKQIQEDKKEQPFQLSKGIKQFINKIDQQDYGLLGEKLKHAIKSDKEDLKIGSYSHRKLTSEIQFDPISKKLIRKKMPHKQALLQMQIHFDPETIYFQVMLQNSPAIYLIQKNGDFIDIINKPQQVCFLYFQKFKQVNQKKIIQLFQIRQLICNQIKGIYQSLIYSVFVLFRQPIKNGFKIIKETKQGSKFQFRKQFEYKSQLQALIAIPNVLQYMFQIQGVQNPRMKNNPAPRIVFAQHTVQGKGWFNKSEGYKYANLLCLVIKKVHQIEFKKKVHYYYNCQVVLLAGKFDQKVSMRKSEQQEQMKQMFQRKIKEEQQKGVIWMRNKKLIR